MMYLTRIVWLAAALLAAITAPAVAVSVQDHGPPSRGPGLFALQVPAIFEINLSVAPLRTMTCETRNLTGRADPVLHVLRESNDDGPVREVARDDDSAGALNARVRFRALVARTRFVLVVRAAGALASGTADLFCDGRLFAKGIGVNGAFKRLRALDSRETLRTVTGPGGPAFHTLYLLDDAGSMQSRHVAGPADSAFAPGGFTLGRLAMIGSRWPDAGGEVRLIRNDNAIAGRDSDGDGLGTGLERVIGTCSSLSGIAGNFECSRAADPRDTDGDGLKDGLEVLGKLDVPPFQHLPRWGADPRHKDIFIEVDFGLADIGEAAQRMDPVEVARFADAFGDAETSPVLRLLHAQQLINPDLTPGIAMHLDIGVDPPAGSPRQILTSYGDWGGFSVVQPVCSGGVCVRAKAGTVHPTKMDPARRGIFHYALGDPGRSGSAGPGIALNFPMGDGVGAAHEFGHTLDLQHEGKVPGVNCSPTYPSLMNYAFRSRRPAAFGDGFSRPVVNNANLREAPGVANPASITSARFIKDLREVFGLTVDSATGNVDWNRDGVYGAGAVRAYASFAPRAPGGCEIRRDSEMTAKGLSDVAPALARLGRRVLLFYIDETNRTLRLEASRTGLNCPKLGADCGGLEPKPIATPWNAGILSVDATTLTDAAGAQRVLVVFRTAAGLFEATVGPAFDWTAAAPVTTAAPPIAEISVTGKGDLAWLAYRTANGSVLVKARNAAGGWTTDELAVEAAGEQTIGLPPGAGPGLLLMTDQTGRERLLGAFPVKPGRAATLYERNPGGGPWTPFRVQPQTGKIFGRPALAAVPVAPGSPLPARIEMLFVAFTGSTGNIMMQSSLVANDVGPNAGMQFVTAQHDNEWYFGNGADLLVEPGGDSNLRAAISTATIDDATGPDPHNVVLRPKADGIVDFDQRNFGDWETMGRSLCLRLRETGAGVTCPAG